MISEVARRGTERPVAFRSIPTMDADIRHGFCRELQRLLNVLNQNLGTPQSWGARADPALVEEYNEMLARLREFHEHTTPDAHEPTEADLVSLIETQMDDLGCPEEEYQLAEADRFDD
jgi:hypothetical protein